MADFVCSHERFVDPEYVRRDNVSLFFLQEDVAVFAETDPGIQTWRLKYGAFVREATEQYARRLISMPIGSLIKLGEKIGEPKEKICFLFNTARCGSTLLSQMLEHTDQCVAISEPDGLNFLAKKYRDNPVSKDMEALTRNFINVLCKPVDHPKCNKAYFVKLTAPAVVALPYFYKLYPNASYLFMYRNVVNVAKSIYRITQVMPVLLATLYGGCISEGLVERFFEEMGISGKDYKMRYKDLLSMGTSSWCISTRQYLDLRQQVENIRCLRYEDLIADPVYAMTDILRYCELPEELAESAVDALKQDSQKKSVLSGGSRFKAPELTAEREKNMNEVLTKFKLPRVGDSDILEGILAWKGGEE